ncbi:hypothetical protein BC938DRAFT_473068 [Jimgerdemannia flammicorona]|uniref:JmjC domain-containing protein n=1 Tax=Jimgerdemannia flammicorona TaxID=994334 RepID=A0A433Q4P6_9FUNG|nr:hypothetical protein BC938DRAFT_473068 [Jimgerdemannia flammicorona]
MLTTNAETPTTKPSKPPASTNALRDSKQRRYDRKIDRAKIKARSEIDLFGWHKHNYAANDYWISAHVDTVERIDVDRVSKDEFIRKFEEPSLPVVITGCTRSWAADQNWSKEVYLLSHYADQTFKIGEDDSGNNVYLKLKHFLYYADGATGGLQDDSPLYIFDSGFERSGRGMKKKSKSSKSSKSSKLKSKTKPTNGSSSDDEDEGDNDVSPLKRRKVEKEGEARAGAKKETAPKKSRTLLEDYAVPEYFVDDLFRLTGERRRPPYRWFVMGGARSGTGIHIDPLGTSAWNALLTGHKRWCMFPPTCPRGLADPPMKSWDREAVSWFTHVFPRFLKPDPADPRRTLGERWGMVQCLQGPGETMFVPGGWAHVVMNLDFTIAVTQNFCSPTNLESVFLRTRDSRPKLALKLSQQIELLSQRPDTARAFAPLRDRLALLRYVPSVEPSSGSSSSSSTSSSSDVVDEDGVSATESESDTSDGTCMCKKCKMTRKRKMKGHGNAVEEEGEGKIRER